SSYHDMREPATNLPMRDYADQWTHFAAVFKDGGFDGETDGNGQPIVAKIYRNGELKNEIAKRSTDHHYVSNNLSYPMTAFLEIKPDGSKNRRISGYMKHFHIWKIAKDGSEINALMNGQTEVTGDEPDLVCGWSFDTTVERDDQ